MDYSPTVGRILRDYSQPFLSETLGRFKQQLVESAMELLLGDDAGVPPVCELAWPGLSIERQLHLRTSLDQFRQGLASLPGNEVLRLFFSSFAFSHAYHGQSDYPPLSQLFRFRLLIRNIKEGGCQLLDCEDGAPEAAPMQTDKRVFWKSAARPAPFDRMPADWKSPGLLTEPLSALNTSKPNRAGATAPNCTGLLVPILNEDAVWAWLEVTSPATLIWDLLCPQAALAQWHGKQGIILSPPNWEHPRSRKNIPLFLYENFSKSPIFKTLKTHVCTIGRLQSRLMDHLIPLVQTASWKENAGRIMHELSGSLASTETPCNALRSELSRALLSLRYFQEDLSADSTTSPTASSTLPATIDQIGNATRSLGDLSKFLQCAKNKVLWYFYLTNGQLKSQDTERKSLLNCITDACAVLGAGHKDWIINNPEQSAWQKTLTMPSQFHEHCFQAIFSNAIRHRIPDAPVTFAVKDMGRNGVRLTWANATRQDHFERLRAAMENERELGFGILVARAVAKEFFGEDLLITANEKPSLHIQSSLRIRPFPAESEPFYDLTAFAAHRKAQSIYDDEENQNPHFG